MADFVYTNAKRMLLAGELDLASDDIRVRLLMSNTTADADEDAITLSNFGVLGEFNGTGYSFGGVALTTKAVAADNGNNRSEFTADDTTFSNINNGTSNIQAALIYKFVDGTTINDIPIAYVDSGGFPKTANGSNLVLNWDADGIFQGIGPGGPGACSSSSMHCYPNFVFTNAKRMILAGELDMDASGDDLRVMLLADASSAGTEEDAATISAFTTKGEWIGAGYVAGGKALTGKAVTANDSNNRGEFNANDSVWPNMGPAGSGFMSSSSLGVGSIVAALLYKYVDGTDANNIPVAYATNNNFPLVPDGSDVAIRWNSQGAMQAQ